MFYVARITHNFANGWKTPSGPKNKSRNVTEDRVAFEALYDFGFEEWFRADRHEHGDYLYGYMQGLTDTQINNPAPILLYTLLFDEKPGAAKRLVVGVLNKWEHVTDENSVPKEIQDQWVEEMRQELSDALRDVSEQRKNKALKKLDQQAEAGLLFNIRYLKSDFTYCLIKAINASVITKNNTFTIEEKSATDYNADVQKTLADLGLS